MPRVEIKSKTFFQIPPKPVKDYQRVLGGVPVVFMDTGFDLSDVIFITEPVMVRDLHYQFSITLSHQEEKILPFDFKRKQDCIMAQRELTRAWTKTGEFECDEDTQARESPSPE